jgi:putative ABC transport system substrate-binding protein
MRKPLTRRRVLAGGIAVCATTALTEAAPSRARRVALVTSGGGLQVLEWIKGGLQSLGYEEGRNLSIDFRQANGRYGVLPHLMAEVIALNPDVIVAEATPAIAAAQRLTSTIPIVMAPATDPIGSGFVKSFARPGGNITGLANMFGDLTAKTLDFVRLVFPAVKKIGILTSSNPTHPPLAEVAIRAAAAIDIAAEQFGASDPEHIDTAFADMKAANCEVVYVLADPPRPVLPPIALKYGLPAVYQVSTYPDLGGLMCYGPDIQALFARTAHYIDRIFKGDDPAEMPVEQPTKFVFIINLRTAKAMNLSIPERVLLMADRVIE